jgi:hypothetical protein
MRGSIKLAKVSIKYNEKTYKINPNGRKVEFPVPVVTKAVEVILIINEEKRVVKFKERVIKKVCLQLHLNYDKLSDPNINSVEILKDLGKTNYDID